MLLLQFSAFYAGPVAPAEGDRPAAGEQSLAAAFGTAPAATKPGTPMNPGGSAGGRPASMPAPSVSTAGATAAAPAHTRTLAQRAIDRVPVKWLSTAALAVFLGATALFGGLETVPPPETPVVAVGETVIGAEIEMTPVQATVIDELTTTGVNPDDGERILSLVIDARNLSEFARTSSAPETLGGVRVEGMTDVLSGAGQTDLEIRSGIAPVVARLDDGTFAPWLQPEIPVRLVLSWAIPAGAFGDGDTVRLSLPTANRGLGQSVLYGVYWPDQRTAAYTDVVIEDLGAGDAA